jgi:hypothetical protein
MTTIEANTTGQTDTITTAFTAPADRMILFAVCVLAVLGLAGIVAMTG